MKNNQLYIHYPFGYKLCLYYQPPMTSGKRPAMPVSKRLPGYRKGSLFLPRTEIRERVCDRCTHAARSRFWRYLLVCFRSGNDQINTKTQFKHRFKAWKEPAQTQCSCGFTGGRSDVTWTHGLLVPNQALYQTEPHPVIPFFVRVSHVLVYYNTFPCQSQVQTGNLLLPSGTFFDPFPDAVLWPHPKTISSYISDGFSIDFLTSVL